MPRHLLFFGDGGVRGVNGMWFAMLEAGLVRSKNTAGNSIKNIVLYLSPAQCTYVGIL